MDIKKEKENDDAFSKKKLTPSSGKFLSQRQFSANLLLDLRYGALYTGKSLFDNSRCESNKNVYAFLKKNSKKLCSALRSDTRDFIYIISKVQAKFFASGFHLVTPFLKGIVQPKR